MSKEEKGTSDCCEGFGTGREGFKDMIAGCCGSKGEIPDCSSWFEKFRNVCCGHSAEEDSTDKNESKKGCC